MIFNVGYVIFRVLIYFTFILENGAGWWFLLF